MVNLFKTVPALTCAMTLFLLVTVADEQQNPDPPKYAWNNRSNCCYELDSLGAPVGGCLMISKHDCK